MASSTETMVDPLGDVVLICGTGCETQRLRVSSTVLSSTSQVFRALLSPRFREGKELAATARVEVALPEDDPHVMRVLLSILHLRNNDVPYSLSPEEIYEVALLADKYACMEATKSTARSWIREHLSTKSARTLSTLLAAAYYFDDAPLFRDIGENLLWRSVGALGTDIAPNSTALTSALEAIGEERPYYMRQISSNIEELIHQISSTPSCFVPFTNSGCAYPTFYLHAFITQLEINGLYPQSARNYQTMAQIMHNLSAFDFDKPLFRCHPESPCGLLQTKPQFTNVLRALGQGMKDEIYAPCLQCVREDIRWEEGDCDH